MEISVPPPVESGKRKSLDVSPSRTPKSESHASRRGVTAGSPLGRRFDAAPHQAPAIIRRVQVLMATEFLFPEPFCGIILLIMARR